MSALTPIAAPLGFNHWHPILQAVALAGSTFVQEDAPTVTAAILASAGGLSWTVGFLACFFGIWSGDALLYLVARQFGRPLLQRRFTQRLISSATVARSEQWLQERGAWLLFTSRFVPGTRLPTYLAAGFLNLAPGRSLAATALAVAVWTTLIFGLAGWLGAGAILDLKHWLATGWRLALAVGAAVIVLRASVRLCQADVRRGLQARLTRARRWEFWPAWLFYLPVALHYLRLAVRYRGVTLPTAANPGIFSGGFVGESKFATLAQLSAASPDYTALAFAVPAGAEDERLAALEALGRSGAIRLPFILKPDVGQRGVGVKLISNWRQAADYLAQTAAPLLAQQYAPGPREVGIFYYRFPHQARGRIFAITEKIFPTLTGDGERTVEELLWRDRRAWLIADKYLRRLGERRALILPRGATLKLVKAGNHAQGCIFRNGAHLWSVELEQRIDAISQQIEGFYIGRYDIRYQSDADLRTGRNFRIIELNGATAEATSIYDARNSLRSAYRTLFQQWELVFAIGAANRQRGVRATAMKSLWSAWRRSAALAATYPVAD